MKNNYFYYIVHLKKNTKPLENCLYNLNINDHDFINIQWTSFNEIQWEEHRAGCTYSKSLSK